MSLIGSLEDLSLGDILQIISLSQKSGVLNIRGAEGDGQILFRDGMVRAALVKGGAENLRGILVDGGFVSSEDYASALEQASGRGSSLEEALATHSCLSSERIDSLRREAVESAVVVMFSWRTGEFSFDVGNEEGEVEQSLVLPTGVNAQYLAMEGLRLRDEAARDDGEAPAAVLDSAEAGDENGPASAEAFFGIASPAEQLPDEQAVHAEVHAEVYAEVEAEEAEEDAVGALVAATAHHVAEPELDASGDDGAILEAPLRVGRRPVIVIDPELAVLEWVKTALSDAFQLIHIFQRSEQGLSRIRQYLARAQTPLLLVAPGIDGNPLSGIPDARDFVHRLKKQAPRMPVLWLGEEGESAADEADDVADGWLWRPSLEALESAEEHETSGSKFCAEAVAHFARSDGAGSGAPERGAEDAPPGDASMSSDGLRRLKSATAALGDASLRGDVLPLVIRFASESFSRVAMFMVRGQVVSGMVQRGFEADGGPNDLELRAMTFEKDECSWFRRVVNERRPLRDAAQDAGDERLLVMLGGLFPEEAYLAPIESGGEVVAILYADQVAGGGSIGDTSALEVVLHHAGLALDRAALERALAQVEDEER